MTLSLKVHHLLILSSAILGRIDLLPIELAVYKLFCGDDDEAVTLSVISYIYWDEIVHDLDYGRELTKSL